LLEAKQAGKLRYIGFTGHKDPHIHLYMLEVAKQNEFHFDAVQLPLNVIDAHCRSFAKLVLPELVKEEIGVLAMKTMANGSIVHSKTVTPIEALHYALNLPVSVVIAGMENMEILDQAFGAVRTFKPLSAEELAALLDKTRHAAARGEFEPFKTSSIYDATALTPSFLGDEPERLQALVP
jgi:aryl-alcohol dehydrogenase-like predicted oxidoreductase